MPATDSVPPPACCARRSDVAPEQLKAAYDTAVALFVFQAASNPARAVGKERQQQVEHFAGLGVARLILFCR
jgi:hypothetical protein